MKFLLIACVALTTAAFADSTTTPVKKDTKSTTTSEVYRDSTMKTNDGMMTDEKQEVIEETDKSKQKMEDGMNTESTKKTIEESTTTEEY